MLLLEASVRLFPEETTVHRDTTLLAASRISIILIQHLILLAMFL